MCQIGDFNQEILSETQKTQYADAAIFVSPYAVRPSVSSGQEIQFFGCNDWFLEELVLNAQREPLQALFRREANDLYQVLSGKTQRLKVFRTNSKITLEKKGIFQQIQHNYINFKKGYKQKWYKKKNQVNKTQKEWSKKITRECKHELIKKSVLPDKTA